MIIYFFQIKDQLGFRPYRNCWVYEQEWEQCNPRCVAFQRNNFEEDNVE